MQGKAPHKDGQFLTHFRSEINVIGQLMGKLTSDISALTEYLNTPGAQGNPAADHLSPSGLGEPPYPTHWALNPLEPSGCLHPGDPQPTQVSQVSELMYYPQTLKGTRRPTGPGPTIQLQVQVTAIATTTRCISQV